MGLNGVFASIWFWDVVIRSYLCHFLGNDISLFVEAVQVGTYLGSNALLASFVDKEMVSSAYFQSSIYQAPKKI